MSKVSGGEVTVRKIDGTNYTIHSFYESSLFITDVPLIVDFLVIGGGGGGGGASTSTSSTYFDGAGGGGAGGFREIQSHTLLPGEYTITVGQGGAGGSPLSYGSDGGVSSAFGITSAGGGGGAQRLTNSTNYTGRAGASGGGGARLGNGGSGNTPSVSPVQGYPGFRSQDGAAGGGGGAGEGSSTTARIRGGDGRVSIITGDEVFYAGGGGGGVYSGTYAAGGLGGGGGGSRFARGFDAVPGTDGLGGGGGGGCNSTTATSLRNGAAGGSGIVIIRYSLLIARGKIFTTGTNPARRKIVTITRPTDGSPPVVLDYTFSDENTGEFELIRLPGTTSRIIFDDTADRIDKVRMDE